MSSTNDISRGQPARGKRIALLFVPALLAVACAGGTGSGASPSPLSSAADSLPASAAAPPQASGLPAGSAMTDPSASAVTPATPGPTVPRVAPLQPPAYASRVVVQGMDVDLPVISGDLRPPPSYPFCDVAAYVTRFNQPYESGVTYISAHAQRGMFLPLLEASERNDGQELLGKAVDVYVGDGRKFTYRIEQVVRHATDYAALAGLPFEERHLVLQTSEGPYGTTEKLQVIAQLESESTVDAAEANPEPAPRECEPDESLPPVPTPTL